MDKDRDQHVCYSLIVLHLLVLNQLQIGWRDCGINKKEINIFFCSFNMNEIHSRINPDPTPTMCAAVELVMNRGLRRCPSKDLYCILRSLGSCHSSTVNNKSLGALKIHLLLQNLEICAQFWGLCEVGLERINLTRSHVLEFITKVLDWVEISLWSVSKSLKFSHTKLGRLFLYRPALCTRVCTVKRGKGIVVGPICDLTWTH